MLETRSPLECLRETGLHEPQLTSLRGGQARLHKADEGACGHGMSHGKTDWRGRYEHEWETQFCSCRS
jgi:hypothetical protein